ncbi:expressed unknown protein [Seminavis robusta]|uniref:Uncharacterized protein n=1 Tax=Seminavis robusta TaxID=568900 RepID=A0A9N8HF87_9STRA|nr:expressed unknown protein [Seminavis robusta]|eukprot:Sro444_g144310.1 n/a (423) ;mRNA; r:29852-31120
MTVSPAPQESQVAHATRKSIKKNFPMGSVMSKGADNPITLHSVNDDVFVRFWSLIGETMLVDGELARSTKEAIANLISTRNDCPICINAHCALQAAATRAETYQQKKKQKSDAKDKAAAAKESKGLEEERKRHKQALDYAGLVFDAMENKQDMDALSSDSSSGSNRRFSRLSDGARAECALVVVLFVHMNRVVSAILGEEMSTAMFSVPRAAAKVMESKGMVQFMSRVMSPLLSSSFETKLEAGLTASLFPNNDDGAAGISQAPLPPHLRGALLAGVERANALARLQHWVDNYCKETLVGYGIVSKNLIRFLDEAKVSPPEFSIYSPEVLLEWADTDVPEKMKQWGGLDASQQTIGAVLMLTEVAPQVVHSQTRYWDSLVQLLGNKMARTVVVWWSLRLALKEAKGLDQEIDAQTMMGLLSQ